MFPDLNVAELSDDILKSSAAKELWRPFCDAYKDKLPDHNVGTLMRARPSGGFTEENTILGTAREQGTHAAHHCPPFPYQLRVCSFTPSSSRAVAKVTTIGQAGAERGARIH